MKNTIVINDSIPLDIIIDIKKIDSDIKKMFSEMCECTMWNMYENPLNAYYNGKKITTEKQGNSSPNNNRNVEK